jgi:hypothetical protein
MGAKSRRKGQAGEREIFGLLSDRLGFVVKRHVNARAGDCDSLELPGWACESKRCEAWLEEYWTQACEQAAKVGRKPVLFFRGNRRPWVAMVDLADIMAGLGRGHRIEMTIDAFAALWRETVNPA